ncbi:TetR family transcriptional regulator [Streptomyces caatingaensis]|uniref:Transcriptional regulator n=1 Tax=Streptomyces caatingaensis TaxID=1678637 RepID=A0A0K9XHT2_9ACTN|nr:TetR family transcriptional regulator [Streptomyces caatingaensis]KNB52945.1 transcriptional regulator [Streptomyces caatingaensis]
MQAIDGAVERATLPGLRERKKRRTRNTLTRCALELFARQGYDGTTVDEIAEAADVSQRTFFRYFANKEEVALALQEVEEEVAFAALAARPPHEPPLTALCNAAVASGRTVGEAIEAVVPLGLHLSTQRMIESTPQLLAARLRRLAVLEERFAAEIARREGLDPAADPRPRVLVAACSGVLRAASRVWGEDEDGDLDGLLRLITTYLEQIGPALAEGWRAAPAH